ncbi:MAG: hypothetical protein K0R26_533 [Bacteroidota bacterium]|jgi:hypothetical protein|nr:hypothetical protein [Bacteroidota bacterium]
MKTIITFVALIATLTTTFTSCKKDKKNEPDVEQPAPPTNESELITTMKVVVYDTTTHISTTYVFRDLDGPGGNPATFANNGADSVINILSNHVYKTTILLLDETKNPVDTISNEVEEEGVDHMIFFNSNSPTGTPYNTYLSGSMTNIKYLDLDANNRGIGLSTLWTAPGTATPKSPLTIELKHQPGVKDGSYAPGETDIQVTFKLKVN